MLTRDLIEDYAFLVFKFLAFLLLPFLLVSSIRADEAPKRWWIVGGQLTHVSQVNTSVPGPYFNPAVSFGPDPDYGWSVTASLFAAVMPWKGALFKVEPEYANGRGMPNASGLAGYPNGEIVRTGTLGRYPPPYIARGFYHQALPLGLEFTVGKFAVNDFFDVSRVASDPRHHFLNWALMEQGAWDYAADTRGYTYGIVVGLEKPRFAVRGGIALMPKTANGIDLDWNIVQSRSEIVEGELRYHLLGRPGSSKILMFVNHAPMGNYATAIASAPAGSVPDITSVARVGAIKFGGGLLVDHPMTDEINAFFRVGANDGQTETFAFTEIDRSVSFGAETAGKFWHRPGDHLAFGAAFNGLSDAHARYLAAGGQGFQLGDGRLNGAWEKILELYYLVPVTSSIEITADAQGIFDPGMNADRGPAGVFGVRLHGQL